MNTRKRTKAQKANGKTAKVQRTNDINIQEAISTDVSKSSQPTSTIAELEKALRSKGNASDSVAMKKYMRDQFDFYGIKSPLRAEIVKEVLADQGTHMMTKDIREFVTILWGKPQREFQYIAQEFLKKHRKKLCEKKAEFKENMEFFKMLITTKSWWDTVDMVACKLVGYLVQTHPTKGTLVMKKWIASDNMWLRRTAILHQLGRKGSTDKEILFQFCISRCHEKEFFIRKAVGWALRDYARTKPREVKTFLQQHKDSLSKLSYNEAAKHLSISKK